MASERRSTFKRWASREEFRERRRREILERQKRDRRNFKELARRLAEDAGQKDDDNELAQPAERPEPLHDVKQNTAGPKMEMEPCPDAEAKKRAKKQVHLRRRREYFARQLMYPEWMIDIPSDLGVNWYVLPRPEGVRCLVISARGKTISRKRSGAILHNFPSVLPNGNKKQRSPDPSILDCVYHSQNQTYYVLDLMCWNGYPVYNSTSEFRHFWVHSKLSEAPVHRTDAMNKFKFAPVPRYPANPNGLREAYNVKYDFQKDGLLFVNKHTHYELDLTPLCLVWKDPKTSRFMVDSSDGKNIAKHQVSTLLVKSNGDVVSLEALVVGRLPTETIQSGKIKLDALNKFHIKGIISHQERDQVEGLTYAGPASKARLLPDSWGKILFQYCARNGCTVSILDIAKKSAASKVLDVADTKDKTKNSMESG